MNYRGPVNTRIAPMPMQIKTQREGDRYIAVVPAYILPTGLVAEAPTELEAIKELHSRLERHWSGEERKS